MKSNHLHAFRKFVMELKIETYIKSTEYICSLIKFCSIGNCLEEMRNVVIKVYDFSLYFEYSSTFLCESNKIFPQIDQTLQQ
jgi:hypothetical protein